MFSLSLNFGIPQPNVGSVYVRLNKGDFVPGEQVSGTILLDLYSNFNSNIIWLAVAGVEQTKLVEERQVSGDGNRTELIDHNDQNFFFSHKIPVYRFPQEFIPSGQYSFPFSFLLNSDLPSTFDYKFSKKDKECFAKVSYEIRASLESTSNSAPAISYTCPFVVNQKMVLNDQSQRKEINQSVSSCCCIDKGQSKIVSYFEKSEYIPGEVAYLVTEVDNSNGKAKINTIDAIFQQHLVLKAGKYEENIHEDLNTMSEPGVGIGEQKVGDNARRLAVALTTKKKTSPIQPTCRGKLIMNEYYLKNQLNVDACICCGDNPNCKLQLNVRNPTINYMPWGAQPQVWRPQEFANFNVQFSNDFRLDTGGFMGQPSAIQANYNAVATPIMPPPPS